MGSRAGLWAPLLVALLTLDLSVGEFVELQSLSDDDRRARLHLPANCTPRLGASPSIARPGRLSVQVDCEATVVPAATTLESD